MLIVVGPSVALASSAAHGRELWLTNRDRLYRPPSLSTRQGTELLAVAEFFMLPHCVISHETDPIVLVLVVLHSFFDDEHEDNDEDDLKAGLSAIMPR